MAGMGAAGTPGTMAPGMAAPGGTTGYVQEPVKPIDPAAEISRINNNIMLYQIALGAGALGIGLSTCLFVKSIYRPTSKGFHGGDSDGDLDSGTDDDDEEDSEDDD